MYAKVVGVLEVQQEAQLIERLWEGVGQPDDTVTGEGAAQVLSYWIPNDEDNRVLSQNFWQLCLISMTQLSDDGEGCDWAGGLQGEGEQGKNSKELNNQIRKNQMRKN